MALWMDYSRDEVRYYHPLCEAALNRALAMCGLDGRYEVAHHEMTGTLEMDFVVKNRVTGNYLCVVEVKRTPASVKSMRYQYQAQSYVVNSFVRMEQPFFVVTNLEYSCAFRYDTSKKSVASQMLAPGLVKNGLFSDAADASQFSGRLSRHFSGLLEKFAAGHYEYMSTTQRFEGFLSQAVLDGKAWKSGLAQLLYEYIRGAYEGSGRPSALRPVVSFRGNTSLVCHSGQRAGFERIFDSDREKFYPKYSLSPDFLQEMYDLGKQDVSGEIAANMIFDAATQGNVHGGDVATDPELADMVAVLVKCALQENGLICDPAAGSGSLLCGVARGLGVGPDRLWANDVNPKVSELLALKCGLLTPVAAAIPGVSAPADDGVPKAGAGAVSTAMHNETAMAPAPAAITTMDVAAIPRERFENVRVVVMNPPFLSGVHSTAEKKPLTERILALTGEPSVFENGQAGLECVFVELICALAREGCVCACILPKTHLGARGKAAVAFRRLLLERFGLQYVFDYPRDGLFEKVVKDTCVVVGTIGQPQAAVKFISSALKISEIDGKALEQQLNAGGAQDGFFSLMYGVDARSVPWSQLKQGIENGWNMVSSEFEEVAGFIDQNFGHCPDLVRLGSIDDFGDRFKRGKNNNEGAKELLFIDLNEELYREASPVIKGLAPGMVNADQANRSMDVGGGYCHFLKTEGMSEDDVERIVRAYAARQNTGKKQAKKVKSPGELLALLKKEQNYAFSPWHVLIPRAIRRYAQIYYISRETYVSTNFFCLNMENEKNTIVAATWMTTVFYQLLCEFYQKDQEGARKMERRQLADTFIPDSTGISDEAYARLKDALPGIHFLDFNEIAPREIDEIWSEILWKENGAAMLDEALLFLERLVARRRG